MKRRNCIYTVIRRLIAYCLVAAMLLSTAEAQVCSQDTEDDFRECLGMNITSCIQMFATCTASRSVLTVAELVARADELCCDRSAKSARKRCIRKELRQFKGRKKNGELRAFNREVMNNLRQLRRSDCDTAYEDLF